MFFLSSALFNTSDFRFRRPGSLNNPSNDEIYGLLSSLLSILVLEYVMGPDLKKFLLRFVKKTFQAIKKKNYGNFRYFLLEEASEKDRCTCVVFFCLPD